ncbi:GNAT family N-acetyltransferase [Rossellomorea vietnamensis]|uniref:GNAT family N-acetyltransferase n=1 Tax=Rossellomorea vietnamensis TaxID=218284 RepID=A0ACD4C5Z5_9BACI|nr:GNAT family N-acetyltransferase [Rossellomorea vietnamensis]UXH43928.1 GNAT family N-acetyltransferase [Rossellomorea vietnamensis]
MDYLFEGFLENKNESYIVRLLSKEDMSQIQQLQELVVDTLTEKKNLQPLTYEELDYILTGNGLMIGAFTETGLIAFRALLIPPIDEEHLGLDVGLGAEELPRVIYQEISNVHPDYRGNRLQQTLAHLIMQEMGELEQKFTYVACTVAPFNIPSLKDKFKQGMEIAALKIKYVDQLRYVFIKRLEGDGGGEEISEIARVPMGDVEGQQALLDEGWRGISMEEDDGGYRVLYVRRQLKG